MADPDLAEEATIAEPLRKTVLEAALAIILGGGMPLIFININRGNPGLALIESAMMLYSGAILVAVRRTQNLRAWILAFLLAFFTAVLAACWLQASAPLVFVWILLIPVMSYFLLGRRLGFAVTAIYLSGAFLVFIKRYIVDPAAFPPNAIADIAVCAASLFGMAHAYEVSREKTQIRLSEMALQDPLTGLSNRTRFQAIVERERADFEHAERPACLLLLDLDHFKRINDTYGHEAGDDTLCFVARLFEQQLRRTDVVCRIGGEEFAVILANTAPAQAVSLAERLRSAVAEHARAQINYPVALTATIGVAEIGSDGNDLKTLLACADRRMYEGKQKGRNCVVSGRA